MITYELVKQLKEVGFNQHFGDEKNRRYFMDDISDNDYIEITHNGSGNNALDDEQLTLIPTLSELIDACGDGFGGLYKDEFNKWYARYKNEAIEIFIGDTPEEAVAKLWLKLNKK